MNSQSEKADRFRALHEGPSVLVVPNPWDVGTARLLAGMGFEALASTSAGFAYTLGRPDYAVDRDQMMGHLAELAAATELPVTGDLENGYGAAPETVAETIRMAASAGLVGGSIEDATNQPDAPLYDVELAAERIRAAVEAARALPFSFMVTARAENFMVGIGDLGDTIRRLQAYQEAGADVLYAPALKTREQIATLLREVDRPVNVVMGLKGVSLTLAELEELGVRRVSIGSGFARVALGAFLEAAREVREHGSFGFADRAISYADIGDLLRK